MKIRTITVGCELDPTTIETQISELSTKAHTIKETFENQGYEVQTIRLSTQPWEQYLPTEKDLPDLVQRLQRETKKEKIDYFNIGPTQKADAISSLYHVFKNSTTGFCTSIISHHPNILYDCIKETAALIKKLSTLETQGFANLRFAALCNIQPGTPFYPASYHQGPSSFAIGFENSDLVYKAFLESTDMYNAEQNLMTIIEKEYSTIEQIAQHCSHKYDIIYGGIDGSISSSVKKDESIAYAFEHLNRGGFGDSGSVTIAKMITDVLHNVSIKKTGYNGLMLPVLEDHGLSMRNNEKRFNIQSLLLYSSVCGTGLDTIPLPGNISKKQLSNILLDVASLSQRLHKPLSARLLPIPSKNVGDPTEFTFEYFVNSIVMEP